jgi:hypothetical protein
LGLQIETQFCPGMMNGNPPPRAGRESSSAPELGFFDARKVREFTPKKFAVYPGEMSGLVL